MGFSIGTSGFDKLIENAEEVVGKNDIPFSELFPKDFMAKHTEFEDIEKFFEKSDFEIETEEDIEGLLDKDWDSFVKDNTQFSSWVGMVTKAGEEWVAKKVKGK